MHVQTTSKKKNINWAERKELFLNKINEIKKNQQTNASLDIAFRTRFSAALIDCNYYLRKSLQDKERFTKLFLNDSNTWRLNLSK